MADLESDALPVPGRPPSAEALAPVRGPGVRIEQNSFRPVAALADMDDRLLPGREPVRIEVAGAAVDGGPERVVIEELAEAIGDRVATRHRSEPGPGERVLRVHPRLHFGRLRVLQPAVGVGDGDAVEHVLRRDLPCRRIGGTLPRRGRRGIRRGPRARRTGLIVRRTGGGASGEERDCERKESLHGGAVCTARPRSPERERRPDG